MDKKYPKILDCGSYVRDASEEKWELMIVEALEKGCTIEQACGIIIAQNREILNGLRQIMNTLNIKTIANEFQDSQNLQGL